jgi:hypothetical protein
MKAYTRLCLKLIIIIVISLRFRDRVVGIATGYGLDD